MIRVFVSLWLALALAAAAQEATVLQGLVLPGKQVSVSSPVLQEIIAQMAVQEGDRVTEGHLLVQLRDAKEKLAVQEGQKLVENADFVWRGADALWHDKMGSKEVALKARTELDLAKIRLAAAEEQLGEKTILAPLSGIVVKVYKQAGEAVDRVEKLVDIVDIDQVLAQFYLPPKYLRGVKENQTVAIVVPELAQRSSGTVDLVDPRIDAGSGLFRIKVRIDNRDHRIKAGLKATIDLQQLKVPPSAAPAAPRANEVEGLVLPFMDVNISSPVLQEVISNMAAHEGRSVEKDAVLVELRNAREKLAVQEAEKLVENADFIWQGADSLARDRVGSKEVAVKAKTDLELAKIRLATAQEQLKEKTVRSPLAGLVVKTYKETGEAVDRVEKLVEVVNINQVKVQVYLSPKYLSVFQVGQQVHLRLPDLDDRTYTGQVDFVAPRVEATSGTFQLKVLVDNPDHEIKAGLKALLSLPEVK